MNRHRQAVGRHEDSKRVNILRTTASSGQSNHSQGLEAIGSRLGRRRTEGSWAVGDDRLCFTWAQNFRKCWPCTRPFERGETVRIRSDRGNDVQVMLN